MRPMKYICILAAGTLCILTGCANASLPGQMDKIYLTGGQFTTTAQVVKDQFTAQVEIARESPQSCKLGFLSPDTLQGMEYIFTQGAVELRYQELCVSLPPDAVPAGSIAKLAVSALEQASIPGGVESSREGESILLSGFTKNGAFTIYLDAQDRTPRKLLVPRENLEIVFENFEYLQ